MVTFRGHESSQVQLVRNNGGQGAPDISALACHQHIGRGGWHFLPLWQGTGSWEWKLADDLAWWFAKRLTVPCSRGILACADLRLQVVVHLSSGTRTPAPLGADIQPS